MIEFNAHMVILWIVSTFLSLLMSKLGSEDGFALYTSTHQPFRFPAPYKLGRLECGFSHSHHGLLSKTIIQQHTVPRPRKFARSLHVRHVHPPL